MGHSFDPEVVGCLKFVSGTFPNLGWNLSVYGSAIVLSHAHRQQVVENDALLSLVFLLARFLARSRTQSEPLQLSCEWEPPIFAVV